MTEENFTSESKVVLDPTGLYDIPENYLAITTELQWLESFLLSEGLYWIKGQQLCDWTKAWLKAWKKEGVIQEIKPNLSSYLQKLLQPFTIPETWDEQECLTLVNQLNSYQIEEPLPYFLAEITSSNPQEIWLANPSVEHLAQWLTIEVPQQYQVLEKVWQSRFQDHPFSIYYQTEDKRQLLRQWLQIAEPFIPELGKYPLEIPDDLSQEFEQYWQEKIYQSEGQVLDKIIASQQVGMEVIADIAYTIFQRRPQWLTQVREKKVTTYLTAQQKTALRDYQAPLQPQPLPLDASPQEALQWVTQAYLPYRRWEIVVKETAINQTITDHLALSFVDWISKHYPELKLTRIDNSLLNYNLTYLVQKWAQTEPLLWVVVDGLGWLDHLELISYLTENQQLKLEQAIEPRFSILPTVSKYAKWSLYTQLLPNSSQWGDNLEKAFETIGLGKRYTQQEIDKLYEDLRQQNQSLYCLDTNLLAQSQQNQQDWRTFYEFHRPENLKRIANQINYCLQQYPEPEKLRIIIATDHGQILGQSSQISPSTPALEVSGRIAKGTTDDPRFLVLKAATYDLPADFSIIKGSECCNSFSYKENRQIREHGGGLFPEEVVIGFSSLRQSVQRFPVLISCRGNGKANQPGTLQITIDNPNTVPLTNLDLFIQQLPSLKTHELLSATIPANQKFSFVIALDAYPELPPNHKDNQLLLAGKFNFQYADTEIGTADLDAQSYLIIEQMYSSGFNIDEFKSSL